MAAKTALPNHSAWRSNSKSKSNLKYSGYPTVRMQRKTATAMATARIHRLIEDEGIVLLPGCYDALSAVIVEKPDSVPVVFRVMLSLLLYSANPTLGSWRAWATTSLSTHLMSTCICLRFLIFLGLVSAGHRKWLPRLGLFARRLRSYPSLPMLVKFLFL